MRNSKFALLLVILIAGSLNAQPFMVTATNYAAGFFGVVADETGQPLATQSMVHLIWDSAGDGKDDPSENGSPTDDDILIGIGRVGVTGGAPSSGTFVIPGTAPDGGGWCYVRAFNASSLVPGTYYSESMNQYDISNMNESIVFGIQFPDLMMDRLGADPDLSVDLVPLNAPIVLPATGGSFDYTVDIANTTQNPINFDVWIDLVLPNGSVYGPLLSRAGLVMPVGGTLSRQLTQSLPGGAPEGVYSYVLHTGDSQTSVIINEDGFPFEKSGADGSDGLMNGMQGWEISGWEGAGFTAEPIPNVFFLDPPYPNPFNPSTQLQFGLPETADVRIDVYNILGSRVTTLMDMKLNAGYHTVTWEAPNVASGLYLVQMKAGGFVHTKKAFLLK